MYPRQLTVEEHYGLLLVCFNLTKCSYNNFQTIKTISYPILCVTHAPNFYVRESLIYFFILSIEEDSEKFLILKSLIELLHTIIYHKYKKFWMIN